MMGGDRDAKTSRIVEDSVSLLILFYRVHRVI